MKEKLFIEVGMGIDLHGQNINVAAERAIQNAIQHNSLPGIWKLLPENNLDNMKVNVKLGIPMDHHNLNEEKIKQLLPYGTVTVELMDGGMTATNGIILEKHNDKNDLMYIVNAVVEVGY